MTGLSSQAAIGLFRKGAYGLAVLLPLAASAVEAKPIFYQEKAEQGLINKTSTKLDKLLSNDQKINWNIVDVHRYQIAENDEKETTANVEDGFPSSGEIDQGSEDKRVLISEVTIEGMEGHPEQERLEFAAYDAMSIRPGSKVTREELKIDLDSVYSTGWFSRIRIEPINGPLGVQLLVQVEPNPILRKITIEPQNKKITSKAIKDIFGADFGKTLNLNVLQLRMKDLRRWYIEQGFSLAKISGPNRVTADGNVQLKVVEGVISGFEISFLNKDGESTNKDGKGIKGKTKNWVIEREISLKAGDIFNRKQLESDIKRLYSTSLFSDVKVTLKPAPGKPGSVVIVLGITEQQTGSLTGGIGYSGGQGVFGQIGLQETNFLGRSWTTNLNLTYGQYGGLVNFSFSDPWIKGDLHRTSFRTSVFISREVPQEFRSQEGGSIRGVSDYYDSSDSETVYDIDHKHDIGSGPFDTVAQAKDEASGFSWFDYQGDSLVLQRAGGGFSFARPLNGGDPYKKAKWSVILGMNFQQVKPIDFAGNERPYGVSTNNYENNSAPEDDVICVAFNCATENTLVGVRAGATYNQLNNSRNPTSGDFLSLATEQFVSVGEDSPTFNRARFRYSHFFPVDWLKLSKGCRPKKGEKYDCPQAIGFQLKGGTIVGDLPPYEAFCLGGSNSIRGWSSCDLAVGRSFGEASLEYRFPIWRIVSGALFVDAGSDLGSQSNVPGKPGELLEKPGSGYSLGTGVILNTPVGPLRLEAASQDMSGDWRYNLGVGWKF